MTVTNETEQKQAIYENVCEHSAKNIILANLAFGKILLILVAVFVVLNLLLLRSAGIVLLAAIVVITGLFLYQYKRNEKMDRKMYGMIRRVRTFFYEDRIFSIDEADNSKVEIGYHQVQKVMETKKLYILRITSAAVLILDKNGFCKGDETQFQDFLMRKVDDFYGKQPVKIVPQKPSLPPIPSGDVRYQTGCQYTLRKEALLLRRTMKIWYIGAESVMAMIILWGIWINAKIHPINVAIMLLMIPLFNYGGAWIRKRNMEKIYGCQKRTKIYFLDNELAEVDEVQGDFRKIHYDLIDCISERKTCFLLRYVKGAYLIIDKDGSSDEAIKAFLREKCVQAKWQHICL